ncbi:MAG: flagellar filament capping protein FliD [Armatimonadota bacterium]|nr:flagellar filament capping protein FliD [Armatimonadota bacterium]
MAFDPVRLSGLISGINTADILNKLITVERAPITRLESRQRSYETRLKAWQDLNTKLLSLKTKAESIQKADGFKVFTATVSDNTILTATTSSSASTGTYTFTVQQLAKAHILGTASTFADKDATDFGTGTITIQVGSNTPVTITIGAANNTLEGIKNAINQANAEVTASIVNDGTGYRLLITGNNTGAANTVTISHTLTGGTYSLGTFNTIQVNQDAQIVIGSGAGALTVNKPSNTVTDVVPGVTLNLFKASATPVTVTVDLDKDGIVKKVQEFVDAFNSVMDFIKDKASYDPNTKTAGPLFGQFTVRSVEQDLINMATGIVAGLPAETNALSDVGITLGRDKHLTLDTTKFKDALTTKYNDVVKLFILSGTASDPDISFLTATSKTKATSTGYAVNITQAATQGTASATERTQGVTDPGAAATNVVGSETLTFSGALFPTSYQIVFANGTTPAQMASQINGDATLSPKVFAEVDANGHLRIYGKYFNTDFTVTSDKLVSGTGSGYTTTGTNSVQTATGIPAGATGVTAVGETITVDGTTQVTLAAGKTLSQIVNDFNTAMEQANITIRASLGGSNNMTLVFTNTEYGSVTHTVVSDVAATAGGSGVGTTTLTLTGQDVAGTINGEPATGRGQILTGNSGNANTDGLSIRVALTPAQLASQGSSQGVVYVYKGVATKVGERLAALTDSISGTIPGEVDTTQKLIEGVKDQISRLEERLERTRERYIRIFTQMELSLSRMRTQSGQLLQQLANLSIGIF